MSKCLWKRGRIRTSAAYVVCVASWSCGKVLQLGDHDGGGVTLVPEVDRCANHSEGEECAHGRYCSDGECRGPACGDGTLTPNEACDDGNRVDDDGCNNECKSVYCGNGKIEGSETCDDGNVQGGDGCPGNCMLAVCGNGKIEDGEECELPQVLYSQASGQGQWQGCKGCKRLAHSDDDPCFQCLQTNCRAYYGNVDLLRGCFERPDVDVGADPNDTDFVKLCVDLVNCSLRQRCWTDSVLGAAGCYCGSEDLDTCSSAGPAADAACVAEVQRAAHTHMNSELQARFSDFTYPLGWAFSLFDCMQRGNGNGSDAGVDAEVGTSCLAQCAPASAQ